MTPSSFRTSPSRQEWIKALKKDERDLQRMRLDIDALRAGRHIENLRLPEALVEERGLLQAVMNKRKLLGWPSSPAAIEKELGDASEDRARRHVAESAAGTTMRGPYTEYGPAQEYAMKLQRRGAKGIQIVKRSDKWWIEWVEYKDLEDLDVADEIWRQLGRARVMIGAKGPIGDKDSLRFQIGANPKRVKYIKVRLDPSDTYTVTFIDNKGRPLHEVDDIYSDNLARVIEMHTGLRTSL